ncbi:MAG: Adenylate cyclase [Acidobacteriaceae bacterium]|nr:Adenylate cyclase [Acidobacteriaceae bacterium]
MPSYNFGQFELDGARFELRRNGRVLKVERIPLELLILLAERNGNIVSRQEIIERLWGKDVFVDTEHGINTAIRKIRSVLCDDAERPRFVQTIQGKGYRFLAEPNNGHTKPMEVFLEPKTPARAEASPGKPRPWWVLGVAAISLGLLSGTLLGLNVGGVRDRIFSGGQRAQIRSIAVLPLANLSGDPAQDYFADGMTDELITALAKNRSLRVVSRTSAMQYKGVRRPLRDIARELGVDGILEGSVTRSGNRVHMTVQLIYAPSDTHVWAESYDRDPSEVFSLPSELSKTIAKEVKIAVSPTGPRRYINPEAHDAYLQGRYFWFGDNSERSREYFEKAIQLQPDYAAAWSGLADSYAVRAMDGVSSPQEVMEKAEVAARKGIELDDSLSAAHNTRAALYLFHTWNWQSAEAESRRALELDPNNAEAHHVYSYVLTTMQRPDEALQEQKRSSELDPFARPWALGNAFIKNRRLDAAVNEFRLRAEAQPRDSFTHFILSDAYWFKGMWKESVQEAETGFQIEGDKKSAEAVRRAFESGGAKGFAEWWLSDCKAKARKGYVSPWTLASAYAQAGHKEEALRFLEDAYRERSPRLVFIQNSPVFDFLHSDDRYQALVKKMGLPPSGPHID